MPVVKKDRRAPRSAGKKLGGRSRRQRIGGVKLDLPDVDLSTDSTASSVTLGDLAILLYGHPGTGKTTLSAEFPDTYHLFFDPGGKTLPIRKSPVKSWLHFVAYIRKLRLDKTVKTIVVDGLEDSWQMCFDFMCDEVLGIDHPTDEQDYGKSWSMIYREWLHQMFEIVNMPGKGSIFIGWAKDSLFKPVIGEPSTIIRPNIPSKVLDPFEGKMSVVGYMYAEGDDIFMRIKSDGSVMAKVNPKRNFRRSDNGAPIRVIPMGESSEEGYANFVAAFENRLKGGKKKVKLKRKKKNLKRR